MNKDKKSIFKSIFPIFLVIFLFSILSITIYFVFFFKAFYINSSKNKLKEHSFFINHIVKENLRTMQIAELNSICKHFSEKNKMRITVIGIDGSIIADSYKQPQFMENHRNRPEFIEALNGKTITVERFSDTQNKHNIYFASPVYDKNKVIAIIRPSITLKSIHSTLKNVYINIFTIAICVFIISIFVSYIIAKKISKPLEYLKDISANYAIGDFSSKLVQTNITEIDVLSESMSQMANSIQDKISEVTLEKNQNHLVLTNMLEGVIAIDLDNKIILLNKATKKIFNINIDYKNKNISEVIRNSKIVKLLSKINDNPVSKRIKINENLEYTLDIKGVRLKDIDNKPIGKLLVINDITKLVRLENIRKEFASTVSHELKTPLTAIQGAVETLLDGAINEQDSAIRFTKIIHKHSNRLKNLIYDILTISKIEQELDIESIQKESAQIANIINSVCDLCKEKLESKEIDLIVNCDVKINHKVNISMLEQVFINLLDNAITYSQQGGKIKIDIKKEESVLYASIQDDGCGISSEHHSRLFERFYRVNKSRSRQKGGTGLGLAIVKHIIQAHNGKINIKSEVGKGAKFHFIIP